MIYYKKGDSVMCKKDYYYSNNLYLKKGNSYIIHEVMYYIKVCCDKTERVFSFTTKTFSYHFYRKEEYRQIKIKKILE